MKKLLGIAIILLLLSAGAFAVSITFTSSASFGDGYVWDDVYVKNNGTVVNMTGGKILRFLKTANASTLNVSDGLIHSDTPPSIYCFDSSIINISGGVVGGWFLINDQSCVNISGGLVTGAITKLYPDATLNISGGNISFKGSSSPFNIYGNLNISGGVVNIGNTYFSQGTVNISGGILNIDNAYISFMSNINIYGYGFNYDPVGQVLTGHLLDNNQFTINNLDNTEYQYLNLIPEPMTVLFFGVSLLALRKQK
jgi:hypothetical protein